MDKSAKRAALKKAAEEAARRTALRRAASWESPGVPRDVVGASTFSGGGLGASLSFAAPGAPGWGPPLVSELLDLTRANMKELYEAAPGWGGWRDGKKRGELLDADSRFVVARGGGGALLGFASFRFLAEGGRDVLYLYELQLAEAAQRKGLGRHLMQQCERAARAAGMERCVAGRRLRARSRRPTPPAPALRPLTPSPPSHTPSPLHPFQSSVVLTVLKNNEAAVQFYARLGYVEDEASPGEGDGAPYEIRSKRVAAAPPAAAAAPDLGMD
jgi:ribosomal protein S18 acetylase RimI-like enzyme